jgi:hypothetical protein
MTFDNLNEKFNLPPVVAEDEEVKDIAPPDPVDDVELSREAIRHSIAENKKILKSLIDAGSQTQSARVYEVAVQASRAITDSAVLLIKTHDQGKKGTAISAPKNVNVFMGTTKDMMRAIVKATEEQSHVADADYTIEDGTEEA